MADENMLVGHIERFVDSVGGKDGKDGFSPTASVSKTDGVTTVTVTDQNGTTFAHILDGAKGDRGEDGKPGERGADGANGSDGFSPTATVMKADGITTITIADQNGTTSAEIQDGAKGERGAKGDRGDPGERGEKGEDGFSPTVTLSKAGNATTVTVIDKNGTTTAQVLNGAKGEKGDPGEQGERGPAGEKGAQGQRGEKGVDGFSPTISLTKTQGVTTISVTDKDGTTSAQIMDGAKGDKGDPGKDADTSDYYNKQQTDDKITEIITGSTIFAQREDISGDKGGDLDTATKTGLYRFHGNPLNSPINVTGSYGILLVFNAGGSVYYIAQIAIASPRSASFGVSSTSGVFIRTTTGSSEGKWSAWKKISLSDITTEILTVSGNQET